MAKVAKPMCSAPWLWDLAHISQQSFLGWGSSRGSLEVPWGPGVTAEKDKL